MLEEEIYQQIMNSDTAYMVMFSEIIAKLKVNHKIDFTDLNQAIDAVFERAQLATVPIVIQAAMIIRAIKNKQGTLFGIASVVFGGVDYAGKADSDKLAIFLAYSHLPAVGTFSNPDIYQHIVNELQLTQDDLSDEFKTGLGHRMISSKYSKLHLRIDDQQTFVERILGFVNFPTAKKEFAYMVTEGTFFKELIGKSDPVDISQNYLIDRVLNTAYLMIGILGEEVEEDDFYMDKNGERVPYFLNFGYYDDLYTQVKLALPKRRKLGGDHIEEEDSTLQEQDPLIEMDDPNAALPASSRPSTPMDTGNSGNRTPPPNTQGILNPAGTGGNPVRSRKRNLNEYLGLGELKVYIGPVNAGIEVVPGPDLRQFVFTGDLAKYYYPGYNTSVRINNRDKLVDVNGFIPGMIHERMQQAMILVPYCEGFQSMVEVIMQQPGANDNQKLHSRMVLATVMSAYIALGTEIKGGDTNIQTAIQDNATRIQLEPLFLAKLKDTYNVPSITGVNRLDELLKEGGIIEDILALGSGFALMAPAIVHFVRSGTFPSTGKLMVKRLNKDFAQTLKTMMGAIGDKFRNTTATTAANGILPETETMIDVSLIALKKLICLNIPMSANYINAIRFLYGPATNSKDYPGLSSFFSYHILAAPVGVAKYAGARVALQSILHETTLWEVETEKFLLETADIVPGKLYTFIYSSISEQVLGVVKRAINITDETPMDLAGAWYNVTDPSYPGRGGLPHYFQTVKNRPDSLRAINGSRLESTLITAVSANRRIVDNADRVISSSDHFKKAAKFLAALNFNASAAAKKAGSNVVADDIVI